MSHSIQDYLIDQNGVDWSASLANWSPLIPPEFTLWLVTRFADLFLVFPDETVHMLDVGAGTLTKVAENRDDFADKIDESENADNWLMIPLVNQLETAGITLQPGQCYGFTLPPVLGGEYHVDNVARLPIEDYLGAYGSIHQQLRDVPDGAQVVIKTSDGPDQ